MSAMAVSSSLNPDAPLFVPAAFRQVEDFSPQWWDLVKSTAWFRDHWFHQHQQLDDMADSLLAFEVDDDVAALLPDAFDDDLFYDHHQQQHSPVVVEAAAGKTEKNKKKEGNEEKKGNEALLLRRGGERSMENQIRLADIMLKALCLSSPDGGDAPRGFREKPRHSEKPAKYAGSPRTGGAPRVIHQPR